jgi:hypothetical protein
MNKHPITMENTLPPTSLLNDEGKNNLISSAKWAGILAWITFIMLGLIIVIAGIMGFILTGATIGFAESLMLILTFGVGGGIYLIGALFLYKFSKLTKQGIHDEDPMAVAAGTRNLLYFFMYVAILALVGISIYGVSFLGMGLFSRFV